MSSDETKNGLNDAGVAVLNMFNFIQIDSGNDVALKTVNTMFAELKNRDELSVEEVHTFFKKHYRDAEVRRREIKM